MPSTLFEVVQSSGRVDASHASLTFFDTTETYAMMHILLLVSGYRLIKIPNDQLFQPPSGP